MAITWETTITVKDEDTKECSIQAVRTDDSTTPETVNTISISSALLTSQAEGDKVIDSIYTMYLTEVNKKTKISALLATYQNYFDTQLEGKEV